ncbi:MAG: alkyldihydroxyacetonephosphate synthase [Methylobacteriaceae bacterium]|jgi:alkyldihydroxyacetonephosphate synthase|nr:alkyldihydroxyacetonephosphate synthase [Methylobacteriaceae bacterium]
MSPPVTRSKHRPRKFWGWGYDDDELTPAEHSAVAARVRELAGRDGLAPGAEPKTGDFDLRQPRIEPPQALASRFSTTPHDRLLHAYGRSFPDILRMWMRDVPNPPDHVAFPHTENEIAAILDWAGRNNVAVIPFGGGSSVVGGVEPAVGDQYAATISLDLERFDKVHEIDHASRAARIGAGIYGPALEDQLRPRGLTLRHYPQSFQFSTLGGWIVTRSGGHYATAKTHIDDFVESTRVVTPSGIMESRRLPGSGAGPAPDRIIMGSEGILGIVTEAWMRLQDRPKFRAGASVRFPDVFAAARAVRALSQSGLNPTNCRLLDQDEVRFNHVGDRKSPTLILAFESADHDVGPWMARALELARDHGGAIDSGEEKSGGSDVAMVWRNAFIRMPLWRDSMIGMAIIMDTFETAITWDRFEGFYKQVKHEAAAAIRKATGRDATVSCRFTHVYPDGPAPYFTYAVLGSDRGDLKSVLARWVEIKRACNEIVTRLGGTVTHHHAVGRDHRDGYERETPDLFRAALAAAKQRLDPAGILNPGVLIDPVGRKIGQTGAMAL